MSQKGIRASAHSTTTAVPVKISGRCCPERQAGSVSRYRKCSVFPIQVRRSFFLRFCRRTWNRYPILCERTTCSSMSRSESVGALQESAAAPSIPLTESPFSDISNVRVTASAMSLKSYYKNMGKAPLGALPFLFLYHDRQPQRLLTAQGFVSSTMPRGCSGGA